MESNIWRERIMGFVGGSLILVFCAFIYGQYQFSNNQRVLTIGFVDGAFVDVPSGKKTK